MKNFKSSPIPNYFTKCLGFLLLVLCISPTILSAQSPSKEKPNVIVVITDDQGMGDLGCYGNPYIKTPNLDEFYKDAVRFTNYHVSTTCAPSRGAIMTGRHTNRLNVFHTITGRSLLFEDEVILSRCILFGSFGLYRSEQGKTIFLLYRHQCSPRSLKRSKEVFGYVQG